MSILASLFHHRWAVPILAELDRQRGSRFVTLTKTLGLSGESLRKTLTSLIDGGLVARNPGYGHPLRPEYVLTADGRPVAAASRPLVDTLRRKGLEDVGLKKWSMPVILALADRPRRFSELRERLEDVSPRALTLALKDLEATGLVDRRVTDDYPPATVYRLTPSGRPIARLLAQITAPTIR